MGTKLNLHKLMGTDAGYLRALTVEDDDRRILSGAREEIRATLRGAFRNWETHVSRTELFDSEVAGLAATPRVPIPKFRIQGSFAYYTVNDCQDPPRNQIDQDDGLFLPLSFVVVGGRTRPTIASKAYFLLVERALTPQCERKGWRLNPGKAKNSCVRVEINERLHIDLPLYAIRDSAFEELVEFAAADSRIAKSITVQDRTELDERIYRALLSAEIILADRGRGWIESDPRKLEAWFEDAVGLHGPIVRDLCRSFKAMRDAKFDAGLSSICIMACVVNALRSLGSVDEKRLDVAIIDVANEIAEQLEHPVQNPAFPGDPEKCLCNKWDADYRKGVRELFRSTAAQMAEATNGGFIKSLAIGRARAAFGDRVPADEDLITLMGPVEVVRATPAQPQPRPMAPRTKSG
jgi:hypothetical protein